MRGISWFRIVMTALSAAAGSARADIAPEHLWAGPSLSRQGKGETSVEMKAEEVTLTLSPNALQVEAVFRMRNTGSVDEAIRVGFPGGYFRDELKDFHVTRDGKPFEVAAVDTLAGKRAHNKELHAWWNIWEASYPAGKEVTEIVSYRISTLGKRPRSGQFGYTLHTGAGWAGRIGKGKIVLKLSGGLTLAHLHEIAPGGRWVLGEEGAVWEFQDLEPTMRDDIRIRFDAVQTLEERIRGMRGSALEGERDPISILRVMQPASSLRNVDRTLYWQVVEEALSMYVPNGIPRDGTLDLLLYTRDPGKAARTRRDEQLRWALGLFPGLLGEAARCVRDEAGARKALPGLKDLVAAWKEGRVRLDRRDWKRSPPRGVISFPPPSMQPDFEIVPLIDSGAHPAIAREMTRKVEEAVSAAERALQEK